MNWREKFEEAGKLASSSGDGFLSMELSPEKFASALKALDADMDGLSRGDPRYQEACRAGRLTWWDEQGRAVEVVRKGSETRPQFDPLDPRSPDFRPPQTWHTHDTSGGVVAAEVGPEVGVGRRAAAAGLLPKVGDAGPVLDGKPTVITSIEELKPGLSVATYESKPLVVGPPPPPPGAWLGPPAPPPGDPALPPDTGRPTFAEAEAVDALKGTEWRDLPRGAPLPPDTTEVSVRSSVTTAHPLTKALDAIKGKGKKK